MKKKFLFAFAALALIACNKETEVEIESDTVVITYSDNSVSVTIPEAYADYVTYTTDGAHLTLVQSEAVDSTTCGEIEYTLSGSSSNGSFNMEGSYKATISLQGLTLTNPSGPALNIDNGKRIKISAKRDYTSTLIDGADGDWKGCIVCKGHIKLRGNGTLNIYGKTAHAIWSKEYLEIRNLNLNVLYAAKDAINCNQYFLMESGTVLLQNFADDGIQVAIKENDNSEENTGDFTFSDGSLTIDMSYSEGAAIKAEGTVTGKDNINIINN